MTDLSEAAKLIGQDSPVYEEVKKIAKQLENIVGRNQNPNCGGDRKMSVLQWQYLREVANCFKDYDLALRDLREAPSRPHMDDDTQRPFNDHDIPF